MSSHIDFIAIYRTELVAERFRSLVLDPIKIEVVDGPFRVGVPVFVGGARAAGRDSRLTYERELVLPADERFLIISVRTYGEHPSEALAEGERGVDSALAVLGLLYSTDLLSEPIYRGFTLSPNRLLTGGWVRLTAPFSIGRDAVATTMTALGSLKSTNAELARRFILMARFLAKAAAYPPSEERFVMLWTVLEIYPMQDTTDIRPISDELGRILGRAPSDVKSSLGIGRLFGHRSDIIHNGEFRAVASTGIGPEIARLESICRTVMRDALGLPYNGELDDYLSPPRSVHSA